MKIEAERPGKYIEVDLAVPKSIHENVCNYIIENLASGLILEEEEASDIIGIKFYLPEGIKSEFKEKLWQYINSIDANLKIPENFIKTNNYTGLSELSELINLRLRNLSDLIRR